MLDHCDVVNSGSSVIVRSSSDRGDVDGVRCCVEPEVEGLSMTPATYLTAGQGSGQPCFSVLCYDILILAPRQHYGVLLHILLYSTTTRLPTSIATNMSRK